MGDLAEMEVEICCAQAACGVTASLAAIGRIGGIWTIRPDDPLATTDRLPEGVRSGPSVAIGRSALQLHRAEPPPQRGRKDGELGRISRDHVQAVGQSQLVARQLEVSTQDLHPIVADLDVVQDIRTTRSQQRC